MTIFAEIANLGVVPVIEVDDASHALPLADALISGGLPIAEITFRTNAAESVIREITRYRPEMLVGAGTILNEEQVDRALDAGAKFALSPGIDRNVLQHASARSLPFAPGIMTPTDLQAALRAKCQLVKFFPAVAVGGVQMLKNIAGPYLHTGIGFNPTGGVTLENMQDWLSFEPVKAVGGTWIASRADIAAGNWEAIQKNAAGAVRKVSEIRNS